MSAKQRDDAEPDADEVEHDEEAAIDAADEDLAFREWENIGTERLKAYGEVIGQIRGVLYPVTPPDSALAVNNDVPSRVEKALEKALIAMADDVCRLASATGPRDPKEGA